MLSWGLSCPGSAYAEPMSFPPPKLLTEARMASRLGVKTAWLRSEAAAGRLPHVKAGNLYLFDPKTVERVLLERAQESSPAEEQ